MSAFQASFGVAIVCTDKDEFFDKAVNARFRSESFNEVLEIVRGAGFKFKKEFFFAGHDYKNVWIFESDVDLSEETIKAVIEAAAACGLRQNEIALGMRERSIVKAQGFDKIEIKRSESQIIQTRKVVEFAKNNPA